MFVSRYPIRVHWGDCDPAGIVFYPRYFEYFNACTEMLFEQALGSKKIEWTRAFGIVGIPMVDTRARFLVPSRYGDELLVESHVEAFRRTSFEIRHRVMKAGELAVEGFETRVWTGHDADEPERLRGMPIPVEVVQALSR